MAELKVSAAKGDRLTDWLRRPLSPDQMTYAAADVDHLLALQDRLDKQLAELGRSEWVAEACEELRRRPASGTDPSQGTCARLLAFWADRRPATAKLCPSRNSTVVDALRSDSAGMTVPELTTPRPVRESSGTYEQRMRIAAGRHDQHLGQLPALARVGQQAQPFGQESPFLLAVLLIAQ